MPEEDKAEKNRRLIGVLRIVILVQIVVIVALIIAFAVHSVQLKNEIASAPGPCPEASSSSNINLETPEVLSPFYDLTASEIRAVKDFLYNDKDLNLVKPSDIAVNASYIFTIELLVPNKQITLDYLDRRGAPPAREAKVIIFRGDKSESYIEEYRVGPLPNPVYKSDRVTVPFRYRPLTEPELSAAVTFLNREVTTKAAKIIKESYDATMSEDCKEKCVDFQMMSTMGSSVSGQPHTRKMWFWNARVAEFFSLHPLDLLILVDLTSKDVDDYKIDKVFYGGDMFHSLDELVTAYEEGSLTKTRLEFPNIDKNLYSTLNRKGTLFPSEPLSPPITYEPSGKRYSINGRHIKYLGWDFDVRMSTISGPQLFDIKFFDERIVYELSLQEVAVFYSANSPAIRFADYVDSIALIGTRARSLVSGADCPDHSTFLSTLHVTENNDEPLKVDRAFCVFEHNTGLPLRRHLSGQGGKGKFYEGLMDTVLIVRTISTVVNYDYVFDFIFHQNGAIEVKVSSTGYILTSLRFPPEDDYGFQIRERITGNLHHHLFHFKVDIDIHGTANRFEAIDIVPEASDNTLWSDEVNAKYHMTKIVRRQIKSEKEAAIDYNFDAPNYLTFYNKDFKTSTGVPKAYRLLNRGMSKQVSVAAFLFYKLMFAFIMRKVYGRFRSETIKHLDLKL